MNIIPQLVVNSIVAGAIYTLVALGFNLIYGARKFFNIAHGVLAAVGGYCALFLIKEFGFNVFASIFLSLIFVGLLGYGINKFVYSPLLKRKATSMVLLVASLGVFTTIQAILSILFSSQFQIFPANLFAQRNFEIYGGIFTQLQLIIFIIGILIALGLVLILKYTIFGKATRAISDDEEVARIVGINTDKIINGIFFIGSGIAALAGILIGLDTGLEPAIGMSLLLKGVVASIIGGIGNVYGGILGSFLLGFVENFGVWKISGEWKDAIAFCLLILFMLFRPQGILKK